MGKICQGWATYELRWVNFPGWVKLSSVGLIRTKFSIIERIKIWAKFIRVRLEWKVV